MQIIKVPQLAWYNPGDFDISLPDDWQVEECHMAGYNRLALKPEDIRSAIKSPIGIKPLREMANEKNEVAIVFDDMTRITRPSHIVPFILEELKAAGVPDKNIRFICGLGLHGSIGRSDFVKKLGEDVVARFRCFNHNPFGNCVYAGTTRTFKTKLYVNEEYMKCDLKIIIGNCGPHPGAGFGGGSKLVMPGITAFESINWNHSIRAENSAPREAQAKPAQGMGIIDGNPFRRDVDECAELAGIDFLVNSIVNTWGEIVSIYAGDWKQAHAAAVKEAKLHYRTPKVLEKDIVIANNYAKANEAVIGLGASFPMVRKKGGDIVLIANAPEGQVTHYLAGAFGRSTFAVQNPHIKIPANINQVIFFTEYPHPGSSWFEENEKIVYLSRWDDVLQILKKGHGPDTKVAVIPDATNQYFAWYD